MTPLLSQTVVQYAIKGWKLQASSINTAVMVGPVQRTNHPMWAVVSAILAVVTLVTAGAGLVILVPWLILWAIAAAFNTPRRQVVTLTDHGGRITSTVSFASGE